MVHMVHGTWYIRIDSQRIVCIQPRLDLCTMRCMWNLLFTILTVVLCAVPARGDCCRSVTVYFSIYEQSKLQCKDFKHSVYDGLDLRSCHVKFCGDQTYPTPCCGRGSCNIFCCNCDRGCHPGLLRSASDFAKRFKDVVYDARIRG